KGEATMSKRDITNTTKDLPGNLLLGIVPGGLQVQEAIGQREFVGSAQLPRDGLLGEWRSKWEAVGVRMADAEAGAGDPLFWHVTLPAGWTKQPTDHVMWNDLRDERGRVRGRIFYKAAFYDRSARLTMVSRFSCERVYGDGDDRRYRIRYQVKDGGSVVLFETSRPGYDPQGPLNRRAYALNETIERVLWLTCVHWLAARGVTQPYDPTANWDFEIAPAGPGDPPPPEVIAPGDRVSGQRAIDYVRTHASGVSLRIGPAPTPKNRHLGRVSPDDATQLVADGAVGIQAFWVESRADDSLDEE
ncbi:MAG: hypothetical protein V4515_14270, partial [Chloroflexota bacterium]